PSSLGQVALLARAGVERLAWMARRRQPAAWPRHLAHGQPAVAEENGPEVVSKDRGGHPPGPDQTGAPAVSKILPPTLAALGASVLLAACGGGSQTSTSASAAAKPAAATAAAQPAPGTVRTASSSLGTILVDPRGM